MSSGSWIFIGLLSTLAAIILRFWLPQAMQAKIRRAGAIVGKDEPERPTVPTELLPPPPAQALHQKEVHDELLRDAVRLLNLSRARDAESLVNLGTAEEKVREALVLRPDGYESTRLLADLAIARAQLLPESERAAAFEHAANCFDATLDLRKGITDLYIGLGWAWLGVMQYQASRRDAPIAALAAFTAGHATSRGNLWLIKGWGTTVDAMVRRNHPDAQAALTQYEAALDTLPGPAAASRTWFEELRSGPATVWLAVPPLRDV